MTILEIILLCSLLYILAGLVAITIWEIKVEKSNHLFIEEMWTAIIIWPIMPFLPIIKYIKHQIKHINLGTIKD